MNNPIYVSIFKPNGLNSPLKTLDYTRKINFSKT